VKSIHTYTSVLFDCDGVIFDSNAVKTEAFRKVAEPFGDELAQALVDYHVANGGISRNQKFAWFAQQVGVRDDIAGWVDARCDAFAEHVVEGLMHAPARDLAALRAALPGGRWYVVSGGAQDELRAVFQRRGLAAFFDGGIHGSPRNKDQILTELAGKGALAGSVLFLGDSRYDCEVALRHGLDFMFVHAWSEVRDWAVLCRNHSVAAIASIDELASAGQTAPGEVAPSN